MSKYWRTLYRHVTGRNVRFSYLSLSLAIDVVETKTGIGQIVFFTLKGIRTCFSSELFTTIVCCSQHVGILTNSVSARHRAKCSIGLALKCMRTVLSSKLFTTIVCFLQHVEIWTNSVSARHLAKCAIFEFRRRRNEKGYRLDCFSAEGYQNCSFVWIICHDCLLFTARRNIHVTRRNVRFSDFSPSSALDVVETKKAINQIVLTLKVISTDFSSKLFITIVCCSKAVIGQIVLALKCIKTLSARHRAKCPIFGLFAKFCARRRRNKKSYQPNCFSAKSY